MEKMEMKFKRLLILLKIFNGMDFFTDSHTAYSCFVRPWYKQWDFKLERQAAVDLILKRF